MKKLMFLVSIVGMFVLMGATHAEAQFGPAEEAFLSSLLLGDNEDKALKLLQQNAFDINAKDVQSKEAWRGRGEPMLYYVVQYHRTSALLRNFLKRKDLNVNARNVYGATAFHAAVRVCGVNDVREFLKREDLDINAKDNNGETALFYAMDFKQEDTVKELLKREDLDVNVVDKDGRTALYYAASLGHINIVQELLKRKDLDINIKDKDGKTALDAAKGQRKFCQEDYCYSGYVKDYDQVISMIKAESFARTLKEESFIKERLKREISYNLNKKA